MSSMQEFLANGPVPLEAFEHQVGGHSLLMKLGDTICKPLIPREHYFYESIPQEIRTFTPCYYGVITVAFENGEDGEVRLIAHPKAAFTAMPPSPNACTYPPWVRLKCSTGESIHKGNNRIVSKGTNAGGSYTNPWSALCLRNTKQLLYTFGDKLKGMSKDYVVLENLTAKFKCPCILDLKVGTRQHGDDISEEKRKKHIERCANSTTKTLGVRICGLQMYDQVNDQYTFQDKYYGRELTVEDFYRTLREFLFNGVCFRVDILPNLVRMLKELRETIRKQDTYRFFSSSLLILYDGHVVPSQDHVSASVPRPSEASSSTQPPDSQSCATPEPPHKNSTTVPFAKPTERNCDQTAIWRPNGRLDLHKARQSVDLRMIDFAHTTHGGYVHDFVQYAGPDEGYIVGLNTLIDAFEELIEEYS